MTTAIREQPRSVFDTRSLEEIYDEIRQIYLSDKRPWVIGYSGGKDSTTALQLVWHALKALPPQDREKPVYVISTDTLVETPVIVDYIDTTLERIDHTARQEGMPFRTQKLMPQLDNTFWVNLIGKGYPAPYTRFRWCTERLKIQPADRFILERVAEHGEVVLVLGIRKNESATRDQVMSLYKIQGTLLSRHSSLPNAYVYTPVEEFSVDDIWSYLLQAPSPWGNNNRDLVALYRNANAGECPLVVDETTPSCGNSRFGCWVCTVVDKDKSMQGLIDSGEEWMEPLLEFREFLASTQEPANKHIYREHKRRGGQISITRNKDKIARGPYKLQVCRDMLRLLLETQNKIQADGPDPNLRLITPEELHEIRRIWRMERQDWEDSAPQIYREVIGDDLQWATDDAGAFSASDKAILSELCEEAGIPFEMVAKLLDAERQLHGMSRRSSIQTRIHNILHEDWRTEEEVLAELQSIPDDEEDGGQDT